jgi:hypothetical protein
MCSERSLNAPWMLSKCSLNVPWTFPWMFPACLPPNVPWASPKYSLNVWPRMLPEYSHQCSLNVLQMLSEPYLTSFCLVNPRLRYSCGQVVFCVNLGTFCKCLLQLGWGLTGVRSTQTECSLNVPWTFPECFLNVWPWMFPEYSHKCSLNVL